MSATTYSNPIELYRQGVAILTDQLGPVDSIRFLRLLDLGSGDYTAARQGQPDEGTMEGVRRDPLSLRELALRRPCRSHGIRERGPEISSAVAFGEFARWSDEAVFDEECLGFTALDHAIDVLAHLEHFRLVVRGA